MSTIMDQSPKNLITEYKRLFFLFLFLIFWPNLMFFFLKCYQLFAHGCKPSAFTPPIPKHKDTIETECNDF